MKDPKQQPRTPDRRDASAEYALYRKERYQAHILRKDTLSDQAFILSRYDQWILTISGGALAVSVAFLEKIAPKPAPYTLWFLGFAWGGYITSLISGFFAIYCSREALYRQREIVDLEYSNFVQPQRRTSRRGTNSLLRTTVPSNTKVPYGDLNSLAGRSDSPLMPVRPSERRRTAPRIIRANKSRPCGEHNKYQSRKPACVHKHCFPSARTANKHATKGTNQMSDNDTSQKSTSPSPPPPPPPDATIRGITTGDSGAVKGSYTPPT